MKMAVSKNGVPGLGCHTHATQDRWKKVRTWFKLCKTTMVLVGLVNELGVIPNAFQYLYVAPINRNEWQINHV